MESLDELPAILDSLTMAQKKERPKTYVAKYKGQILRMHSGKSSWKAIAHAKTAILNSFSGAEHDYRWENDSSDNGTSYEEREERTKQFRAELFKLIEIVELKD